MTLDDLLEAMDRWHDELLNQMMKVGNQFDLEWIPAGVQAAIDITVLDSIADVLNKAGTAIEQMRLKEMELRAQNRMLREMMNELNDKVGRHV